VVALAAAGSVAWGATQGVSVGVIIHGVEHLTVAKDEHGNWSIRIDDPGDEVGFVKAMHDDAAFNQFNAAEMLQVGHTTCQWLRNGSGPNEIINSMDQKPGMAGISPVLLHKVELDLITNSQMYLCPDTLHNGTVSTPTPTTTAAPAPPEPTTMVATTAPPSTRSPQHENLPGTDARGFVDYSAARCDPGSTPAVMQRTTQSVLVVCEIGPANYYYRGVRLSDSASIELANAVRSSDGFDVTNPVDGTRVPDTTHRHLNHVAGRSGVLRASDPIHSQVTP
jgi:hypothetical protein